MEVSEVKIPYKPRYKDIHRKLEATRFCVLVAHRRFGKTVLSVNHLIKSAWCCRLEHGSYAYVAPFRNQGKEIAWNYLKHYTGPIPDRQVNEGELSITMPNGARIRIFGADNPDALRGLYYDGVVLDEVGQMKPEVWDEIIQPALADRMGWTLFIGTPKGINLFSELYYKALDFQNDGSKDWAAMSFPVTVTNALPKEEVERLKRELSDNAYRQEMLCDFNASSDDILIPLTEVDEAMGREWVNQTNPAPMIFGVDVARFGNDCSVIFKRRGVVAFEPLVFRKLDNMTLADRVAQEIERDRPVAVFVDQGQGTGVIDRLRQLGFDVTEVPFGSKAKNSDTYVNRRIEMWDGMRKWLREGGILPRNETLKADLSAPTYSFNSRGAMQLESKADIKERLRRSPDLADALALTFANKVSPMMLAQQANTAQARADYDFMTYGVEL